MIYIGADHGGYELKDEIVKYLKELDVQFEDMGNSQLDPKDDFPDFASKVAEKVVATANQGILICGTGIGMSIAANKVKGARAALCCNPFMAKQARAHNDANILCLGGWVHKKNNVILIVEKWLETDFEQAERLVRRNEKIKEIEK